jgi:steroid delta-isomerase-like uncharacterized protein
MSIEENKELIRRIYDLWNRKDLEAVFKLHAPGYLEHSPERTMSLEEAKKFDAQFFQAFPDVISTIEDLIAEADKVAGRVTWRGTQTGEFMGIPPTGNKAEMTNTAIFRIAGGKLAEVWATIDELRFMRQLGVIPAAPKN